MSNLHNNEEGSHTRLVQIGQIDLESKEPDFFEPDDLPLLATRNLVLFPGVTIPITLGRENSVNVAEYAAKKNLAIGIICQRDPAVENPGINDLFDYGVVADVLQVLPLPDGAKAALVYARKKFRLKGEGRGIAVPGALSGTVSIIGDTVAKSSEQEFGLAVDTIKEIVSSLINESATEGGKEFIFSLENISNPSLIVNMIASNFPLSPQIKIGLLAKRRMLDRAMMLLAELNQEYEISQLKKNIRDRARQSMDEQKRGAFLQSQMEAIRSELYGDDDDADKLLSKAKQVNFPTDVKTTFDREIEKLRRLNPQSPDYSVLYSYLETLLDLPWCNPAPVSTDFTKAENVLDSEHYGLEKVKERILEQLAMLMHNPSGKSPIICLVGAPGVGKTSLGKSIAAALGREYQRVSLGGLHDESEIRGHRRTYIGAMPGRIIDALKRCKSSNPLLLLDEIDKIGQDYKGDPSAALLEVLDPEQNCRFHDNYIDVDYDLSNVLFIATANTLSTIAQPLVDRMEVIEIPGYLREEKVEIAQRHLLPRKLNDAALEKSEVEITDNAISKIIDCYTAESGVRQLEKNIASIVRKVVMYKMKSDDFGNHVKIDADNVKQYLGVEKYSKDFYDGNDFAGVVAGLAWTSVGGEMLYIESSLSPAKGEKLTLTGNLGNVMKESATIALQYVKAHSSQLGINPELFDKYQLHIHAPEGAIPKDGPSAGITMATSIVSTFKQKKVKSNLAMTGEITLRGKVLPVGGIREKILAAKRAGITDIILSEENRKDIEDINDIYISGMNFHFVKTVMDVLEIAITDEPAKDAIEL